MTIQECFIVTNRRTFDDIDSKAPHLNLVIVYSSLATYFISAATYNLQSQNQNWRIELPHNNHDLYVRSNHARIIILVLNMAIPVSGCGSVGRGVAPNTRGLQFVPSHWQKLCSLLAVEKTKKKRKESGNCPFKKL